MRKKINTVDKSTKDRLVQLKQMKNSVFWESNISPNGINPMIFILISANNCLYNHKRIIDYGYTIA